MMIWARLLLVVAFLLPLLSAAALAVKLGHVVVSRRLLPTHARQRWAQLAALAVAAGFVVYGIGNWRGHLVDPRSVDEFCGGTATRAPSQTPLPLHNICYVDGRAGFDLVPAWINPALAVAALLALVCLVLAVRARPRAD